MLLIPKGVEPCARTGLAIPKWHRRLSAARALCRAHKSHQSSNAGAGWTNWRPSGSWRSGPPASTGARPHLNRGRRTYDRDRPMLAKYWVFWTPKIEAQDAMALCTPHFERRLAVAHVFNVSFNIPRITECADCLTLGEVTP
jgi:hypothetical protein